MNWPRTARSSTVRWGTTAAAVLIAVVWLGSFWCQVGLRQIVREGTTGTLIIDALFISRGGIRYCSVAYVNGDTDSRVPPHKPGVELLFYPPDMPTGTWNFMYLLDYLGHSKAVLSLGYPFLFAAAPACFLWRAEIIAQRRTRAALCKKCGYSRGTLPPNAKCPECGTVPAPAPK